MQLDLKDACALTCKDMYPPNGISAARDAVLDNIDSTKQLAMKVNVMGACMAVLAGICKEVRHWQLPPASHINTEV